MPYTRAQLEALTLPQLQEELRQLGCENIPDNHGRCLDMIIDLSLQGTRSVAFTIPLNPPLNRTFSSSALSDQSNHSQRVGMDQPALEETQQAGNSSIQQQTGRTNEADPPIASPIVTQLCELVATQMRIQQERDRLQQEAQQERDRLQQEALQEMQRVQQERDRLHQENIDRLLSCIENGHRGPSSEMPRSINSQMSEFSSITTNATKFLLSQIPNFGGSEEENVEMWIDRIEGIAEDHSLPQVAMLSAATSKLVKGALKWFNLSPRTVSKSWLDFKTAIFSHFKRRVIFTDVMEKAHARKWLHFKENFQEYAMDVVTILQPLNLNEENIRHCITNGIMIQSVRAIAISLKADSLDDFLEQMHPVALTCRSSNQKKSPTFKNKWDKPKPKLEDASKTDLHAKNKDTSAEAFCTYCRFKGHTKEECRRLKRKESTQKPVQPSATVAAVAETPSKEPDSTSSNCIAVVQKSAPKIVTNGSKIKVTKLNNLSCKLCALLDTGSPISLVNKSTYDKFLSDCAVTASSEYKAVNGELLNIKGIVNSTISLEVLPDNSNSIELHVMNYNPTSADIIIGWDFLDRHDLTVLIKPSTRNLDERLRLFSEVASTEITEECSIKSNPEFENIETDFGYRIKNELVQLLEEIAKAHIPIVEDDYAIEVKLKDESIYSYSPRRLAWQEKLQVRKIIDDLLERGIIQESESPYCARIVPVKKKDGSIRLCIDLRPLNDRVHKENCPFPLIEDHLSQLNGKTVFTLIDLKDSFYLLKVHPDSTKYFSFATPDGQYEFLRVPFGYCEAPKKFQKRLIKILKELIRTGKVFVYMDDILIATSSVQENLEILREVLKLLKSYQFTMNLRKCKFLKKSIEYLGYIISDQGITLSPRHVDAVQNFPKPRKLVELQRFLGLTNYFRKFINNYATIAKPLQNLLRKNSDFKFDENCLTAFNTLKSKLASYLVLRIYNPNLPTELHTDASAIAVAGILLQKQDTGQWAPIAFFSQSTNKAEANYHSFELEMLAIVRSVERFHIYLSGIKFTVVTDCNALVFAMKKTQINPRIVRWTLELQNYDFDTKHREGKKMLHVDALSRVVASIDFFSLAKELQFKQLQDPKYKLIAEKLEETQDDEKFTIVDGLVFRKYSDKLLFAVPESMIPNIIRIYHDNVSHCGTEKTVQGILAQYWFPSMRKRVQTHIDNCLNCLLANTSSNAREGELQITNNPTLPLEIIHIDHFGPLNQTDDGFKHIFLVIDAFSRFTWLFATKSTGSKEAIKHLTDIFNTFGNPQTIVSDRGTAFTSREFASFVQQRNVSHRLVAVAAPWANGLVERVNRFLKSSLCRIGEDLQNWDNHVDAVQYTINNTYHTALKATPSKILLGYDLRNHPDAELIRFLKDLAKTDLDFEAEREDSRELALQAAESIKNYNKAYYDERHKKPSVYNQGDYVLIRNTVTKPGEEKKLKPSYKGPYLVAKVLNKNRYVITDIPGFNISQKPYNSILSPDRMKPWIKPVNKP